jgi:hypothetical protein
MRQRPALGAIVLLLCMASLPRAFAQSTPEPTASPTASPTATSSEQPTGAPTEVSRDRWLLSPPVTSVGYRNPGFSQLAQFSSRDFQSARRVGVTTARTP